MKKAMGMFDVVMIFALFGFQINALGSIDFYALQDAPLDSLVRYNSSQFDNNVERVNYLGNIVSLGDIPSARLRYSQDGRMFLIPYGSVIYEIDVETGLRIDSYDIGHAMEGIAIGQNGLIYVNCEHHSITEVNFDSKTTRMVSSYSGIDIDDIDFDEHGNLIGSDLNQSGNLYQIFLDGSGFQVVANYSGISAGGITYSAMDKSFYFFSQDDNNLWRLPWQDGMPDGDVNFIKTINGGRLLGITTVPEPCTLSLLALGGLALLKHRQKEI